MALYRIMLADDEEEIRDGIIRKIDWEGIGFRLVGAAENGQEALEMAESLHPDVVMTDIKMPFMDGLTLGRRLAEIMPATRLVIFSGFDEFEYAQQAIKLNVAEYILKPVNAVELTGVLQKLKVQLDEEIAEKRNVENLRVHYQKSLPIMRQQFLSGLVEGKIPQNRIKEQAQLYDVDITAEYWAVALLSAEEGGNSLKGQQELVPLSVKQIADENLGRCCRFLSFLFSDYVAVIAMFDTKNKVIDFIDALNQICKLARRFLEVNCSAGIGSVCQNAADLRYSCQGARNALDYRVIMGPNKAIYIEDVEPDRAIQLQFNEQDEQELLSAIKLGTPENIKQAVDRLIARFRDSKLPIGQYQLFLMEMMAELLKVIRTYQLDMEEVFGKNFDGTFHLSDFESLEDLSGWFSETCFKISGLIRRERTNSTKMIAEKAKRFIEENYGNYDISVEMLCDYLHVSPAYFSTIFKRETGMSFVAYLTHVRMEEAIKLLNTTEDKTYEISLKVGYTEPNYFSYVFKKQFGMSPTKYRSNKTQDHG
ncbi:helix-turn-helix domain-containing protein [Youxingia wuxianensis]|uniref:Stage 0 sporulation protein A homolog n=1 Tax=Youxingia wuxianensis TaxID=2763678 RepID=A0A926EP44_9FIRM|nr:helix-turn-helix domain-containing protein [Youxingia wuxianensis]MBC8583984.1 response regulator [Youxingia wuxianensis]